jgi:glycosyltransferase involved in cell wall biosynthesis
MIIDRQSLTDDLNDGAEQSAAGHTHLQIALVTETFPPEVNGVAMTLGRLVRGLRRKGHVVDVIRPQLPADYPNGCPLPVSDQGGEITRPGFQLPNYPELRIGALSLAQLRARWRRSRPDVVHVATEGPMGVSAIMAAHALRLPVTSSFHTNFHSYSDHYGFGIVGHAIFAYLRWVHNRTRCTMVPTLAQMRELAADGYKRVRLLSRGIDAELFDPARRSQELRHAWGCDDDTLVLSTVGRIAHEKNLALSVKAFQAIREQVPNSKLVLVGDGPARAQFSHIDGVLLAGMRCDEDLAAHYASADQFLFPSTTETYGNVVVEAMASGQCPIAYDYAAPAEVIRTGINGMIVPLHDEAALIAAAVQVARDPSMRQRLGRAAAVIRQRRRWPAVINDFEHHLFEALGKLDVLAGQSDFAPLSQEVVA